MVRITVVHFVLSVDAVQFLGVGDTGETLREKVVHRHLDGIVGVAAIGVRNRIGSEAIRCGNRLPVSGRRARLFPKYFG